jgi:chemotaxis protein MotB
MKKVAHQEDDHSQERWLVSYADFMTLMFAFFVILYATSERNHEKVKNFQNSIEKYLIKAGAMGESGARIEPGEKNFSVLEPPIETHRVATPDNVKLLKGMEDEIESKLTEAERKKYLIDIFPEENGIRVVLSAHDIYSAQTAKFSASAVGFIDHIGEILKGQKKRIMIEGHVSEGLQGEYASSWDLASARSVNLLRYLQKKYSFKSNQVAASTYGDSRPLSTVAKNADPYKNDRIEVVVHFDDMEF